MVQLVGVHAESRATRSHDMRPRRADVLSALHRHVIISDKSGREIEEAVNHMHE